MKRIETKLIGDQGKDQDGAGDAGGQADNIDKGVGLVLPKIAPGDFDVIA
jgi:hypothetical protein